MLGCNEDITIWNRYREPGTNLPEIWYRHVIPVKCNYIDKIQRDLSSNVFAAAGGLRMMVQIANYQAAIIPFTESYMDRAKWESLSEFDKQEFFTLSIEDFVALGAIDFELTGVKPFREEDIRRACEPNIFQIKAIGFNQRRAKGPHFRIEGA